MQNHFKTKKKHKEAKDKTSTRQNVGKAGRIANEEDKEGAKEEEAGGAVQKEHGANKRNILAHPRKKGRRRKREKRRTQIENGGEQGEYFSASPKERQTNGERKA